MSGPTLFERALPPTPDFYPAVMSTCCPRCGNDVQTREDAHQRILDLEAQVKVLNSKAAAAVDKLADYEDEVQALRAQCARLQQETIPQPQTPREQTPELVRPSSQGTQLQTSPPRAASRLASLSSFLPGRRKELAPSALSTPSIIPTNYSTPNLTAAPLTADSTGVETSAEQPRAQSLDLQSLQSSLEAEKALRLRAESSLTQTQTEIEELTATLFGQANEMVATERKARFKLEERVKMLETRDTEKRRRLDRLEKAMQRIERLRGLVDKRDTIDGAIPDESQAMNGERTEERVYQNSTRKPG